ncbi:hypothetical protein B0H34DRAFT_720173 [Crassisporium funariophilum]|nr:hypothetical protein B0H34DRAFT_720173 [Crassisporium funariophilum]
MQDNLHTTILEHTSAPLPSFYDDLPMDVDAPAESPIDDPPSYDSYGSDCGSTDDEVDLLDDNDWGLLGSEPPAYGSDFDPAAEDEVEGEDVLDGKELEDAVLEPLISGKLLDPRPPATKNLFQRFRLLGKTDTLPKKSIRPGPLMCVVCHTRPCFDDGRTFYPTCGLKCAGKTKVAANSSPVVHGHDQRPMDKEALEYKLRKHVGSASPMSSKSDPAHPLVKDNVFKQNPLPGAVQSSHKSPRPSTCAVCCRPCFDDGHNLYPTCSQHCAGKIKAGTDLPRAINGRKQRPENGNRHSTWLRPSTLANASPNNVKMCDVCHVRPQCQKAGKIYPTCGLSCAAKLNVQPPGIVTMSNVRPSNPGNLQFGQGSSNSGSSRPTRQHTAILLPTLSHLRQHSAGGRTTTQIQGNHQGTQRNAGSSRPHNITSSTHTPPSCIICLVKPCRNSKHVTCGLTCAEKLFKGGFTKLNMCDYCHRRPKAVGHNQCGKNCRDKARYACLLCKSRPRFREYHLCGRICKQIAMKSTPLILEAPREHSTFKLVEKKFRTAWKVNTTPCPRIRKIFKIIENKSFLMPYDRYKRKVGRTTEVFRYHGTARRCALGSSGNNQLCSSPACALCSILKTSFKVSLASPSGAFGAGVYTTSASNKSFSYTRSGTGAIILTKVVLGKVRNVSAWNEVMTLPAGFDSVVFDRQNGTLNETIVYSDDAIRPVFLITF